MTSLKGLVEINTNFKKNNSTYLIFLSSKSGTMKNSEKIAIDSMYLLIFLDYLI